MGELIDFPLRKRTASDNRSAELNSGSEISQDPYYLFIRRVLTTADSCGFNLPFTIDSAAEHVYHKTRHTSQLAKILKDRSERSE